MSITNFNATTPQLKAVKKLFEAYLSLDIKNIEPHIAKDFKFQTFPKIADLPDEAKGTHAERYGPAFALMTKAEVCTRNRLRVRGLTFIVPRPMFTKRLKHRGRLSCMSVPRHAVPDRNT